MRRPTSSGASGRSIPSAPDFLRLLYPDGSLSRKDLTARLAALRAPAAGKLRPKLPTGDDAGIPVGSKGGVSVSS